MSLLKPFSLLALVAALAGCAANTAPVSSAAPENNDDWYLVRTEERVYLFDDAQVFRDFLLTGKAPVVRNLEEQVSGLPASLALRADEQNKPLASIPAYGFLRVAQPPAASFYGEMRMDGRIFAFSRYGDMVETLKLGEPLLRYTDIGGGPHGETVVYALKKDEGRPDKAIAAFHKRYGY